MRLLAVPDRDLRALKKGCRYKWNQSPCRNYTLPNLMVSLDELAPNMMS